MYLAQDFMSAAVDEAMKTRETEDVPVGAVLVRNNEIIARGYNKVQLLNNPLCHAEIIAINSAVAFLGTKYLIDCDMYVTLEPCCMCAGAIVLSRIRRLYIGVEDAKSGACGSVFNIFQDKNLNHKPEIYFGINEEKCKALLVDFFKNIREQSCTRKEISCEFKV